MQCLRSICALFTQNLRGRYAEFTHFTQDLPLRNVYAEFTQLLRRIDTVITQLLRNCYTEFMHVTHNLRKFTHVVKYLRMLRRHENLNSCYAEFTQDLRSLRGLHKSKLYWRSLRTLRTGQFADIGCRVSALNEAPSVQTILYELLQKYEQYFCN